MNGANDFGEPGEFVTFEATPVDLEVNVRSLGYDLARLVKEKRIAALLHDPLPSALVVDVGLPHEDGISFIKRIRGHSSPDVRRLPAIAVTAYTSSGDKQQTLRAGFHRHLAKPIDPADLIDVL